MPKVSILPLNIVNMIGYYFRKILKENQYLSYVNQITGMSTSNVIVMLLNKQC